MLKTIIYLNQTLPNTNTYAISRLQLSSRSHLLLNEKGKISEGNFMSDGSFSLRLFQWEVPECQRPQCIDTSDIWLNFVGASEIQLALKVMAWALPGFENEDKM